MKSLEIRFNNEFLFRDIFKLELSIFAIENTKQQARHTDYKK